MQPPDSKPLVPHQPISAMMLRGCKMRRRIQTGGTIKDDGDRWMYRYREDVVLPARSKVSKGDKLLPDGAVIRRQDRRDWLWKKDFPTKTAAKHEIAERMRLLNAPDYQPSNSITFGQFARKWMDTVMVHHKPSTQKKEQGRIERVLIPQFGAVPLKDISAEMVQTWISGMKQGPKTVRNFKAILSSMWGTAKDWELVQHDPVSKAKLPPLMAPEVYRFSAEEMLAIINEAKGAYKLFLELLSHTGMRPGEAAALRPEDLEGRIVHVRQSVWEGRIQTTKTPGSVRDFPISQRLADSLRQHIADSEPNRHGLIFVNRDGNPLKTGHFVDKILNPILKRLGIWEGIKAQGLRCGNYAFRHGHITTMSRSGVPLKTIQARVGHAAGSEVTMQHYIGSVSQDELAAADIAEAILGPKTEQERVQ